MGVVWRQQQPPLPAPHFGDFGVAAAAASRGRKGMGPPRSPGGPRGSRGGASRRSSLPSRSRGCTTFSGGVEGQAINNKKSQAT